MMYIAYGSSLMGHHVIQQLNKYRCIRTENMRWTFTLTKRAWKCMKAQKNKCVNSDEIPEISLWKENMMSSKII
jgi:hypothetical protein